MRGSQASPAKTSQTKGRHKWTKPTKKPRISRGRETQVVALAMAGQSHRRIAQRLSINREAVSRILSQNEFDDLAGRLRSRVIAEIGDRAVDGLLRAVKKGNVRAILQTLFGLRVLSQTQQVEMKGATVGERDYAYTRVRFYGMHGRWPLDSELLEFEKTLEYEPLIKKDESEQ